MHSPTVLCNIIVKIPQYFRFIYEKNMTVTLVISYIWYYNIPMCYKILSFTAKP